MQLALWTDTDRKRSPWRLIPLKCDMAVRFRTNCWSGYPKG